MSIHLGFEPDAQRAVRIDRRMNRELATSLRYVCSQIRNDLSFDEAAILLLAQSLEEGYRVDADVFASYYDLVSALLNADPDRSAQLLYKLQSSRPHKGPRRFIQLRSPGECELSAVYLGKFLEDSGDMVVLPPTTEIAEQFRGRFERGLDSLRQAAPELAGEVDAIVHEVIPVVGDPTKKMQIDGGSHYQLWGALFLNASFHPTDEAMVEVIAHESAHSLLFGLSVEEALVQNADDELYPSPLRTDLRPMDGIFHATFVSARMCWVMNRMLEAGLVSAEKRDQIVAARDLDRRNFVAGLSVVREHGRLSKLGREVIANAEQYMTAIA